MEKQKENKDPIMFYCIDGIFQGFSSPTIFDSADLKEIQPLMDAEKMKKLFEEMVT